MLILTVCFIIVVLVAIPVLFLLYTENPPEE